MASPPYNHSSFSAISPPYPSNTPLPQPLKRRQSDMPTGPSNKRRKASMLSTTSASSHPLRQTSFPPENTLANNPRYSRSPSMDTMSLVSGVSGPKRKRARKSKGKDDESIVGGKAKSTTSATSGRGRPRKGKATDESEEEEGGEEVSLNVVARTQEEKQKEKEKIAMLTKQLDTDQFARYEMFRAAKLQTGAVRKIINQTLSQSVNETVTFAVKAAVKVYAGEIIEGARKVQAQWDKVDDEAKEKLPDLSEESKGQLKMPLLPEHLVEALRRHRLSREGASTGQLGLWQLQQHSGVERFGLKTGGKRLFK